MPRKSFLLLSLLGTVAACAPTEPAAPVAGGVGPAYGTSNGPANPGNSLVVRFDDEAFLVSVDPANDLVVRHYNAEDIFFCGGSTGAAPAEAQLVLTPNAAVYGWKTGEVPVYVYRLSEVPPQVVSPQLCADLVDKWIYAGTHTLINHDNNLFFDPSRTNAFGWNGNGTVYDRNGAAYHYSELTHVVVDPSPFRVIRTTYRLSIK